jgi:hypothetical protein
MGPGYITNRIVESSGQTSGRSKKEKLMTHAPEPFPASVVASESPIVGGVDGAILEAQRAANAELAKMPHADPRTSDGLVELRALIAPPQRAPEVTPEDVFIDGPGGALRLHIFTPDTVTRR